MENLIEIKQVGDVKSITKVSNKTVKELLKELKLEAKFFALLVNGKRAPLEQILETDDQITILPKIAGGNY